MTYKTPKKRRINNQGFAHYLLPLIVIVLVAVTGTAYMVASHADSVTPSTLAATEKQYTDSFADDKGLVISEGADGATAKSDSPAQTRAVATTASANFKIASYHSQAFLSNTKRYKNQICSTMYYNTRVLTDGKVDIVKISYGNSIPDIYNWKYLTDRGYGAWGADPDLNLKRSNPNAIYQLAKRKCFPKPGAKFVVKPLTIRAFQNDGSNQKSVSRPVVFTAKYLIVK